jgi:hypothetical protein
VACRLSPTDATALLGSAAVLLDAGSSAEKTLTIMIHDTLLLRDELVLDFVELEERIEASRDDSEPTDIGVSFPVSLALLNPRAPAWELLRACLEGIGGCRDAYLFAGNGADFSGNFDDFDNEEHARITERRDGSFVAAVAAWAAQNRDNILGVRLIRRLASSGS